MPRIRSFLSSLAALIGFTALLPALVGALALNDGGGDGGDAGATTTGNATGAAAATGEGASTGTAGAASTSTGSADDEDEDDELGPKGTKALATMKQRLREAKAEKQRLVDELEKAQGAAKSDQDKAIDAARNEGKKEATADLSSKLNLAVGENAILRHVAADWADPDDAVLFLRSELVFDDDGDVDVKALKKASTDKLEAKPHLRSAGAAVSAGKGSGAANGARPNQGAGTPGADTDFLARMGKQVQARTGIT